MSAGAARFRLLGPVEVLVGDQVVDVGPARQRCVLAVLLLDVNRVVSADQVVERVWGNGRLPDRPRNAVQVYMSLLRRALAAVGDLVIVRQLDGYVARADEWLVDVHEFRLLAGQARGAASDGDAVALFERALALWRGDAFGILDTPWLSDARAILDKERRAAERDLADIQLRRGQHDTVLSRLYGWAAQHPLDERLAGQLMLALYRSGRQADAVAYYESIRKLLADELGVDTSPALQQLHQQILAAAPALAAPAQAAAVIPRELPGAVRHFTGREHEVTALTGLIGDSPPGAVVISAIGGMAGVGKTALAVHWAHQVAGRFPDGQLYVNLRGYDPGRPVPPADALAGFLRALGVSGQDIPAGEDERAARYRSLLAGRRMLVLLDNARSAEQVRPLLPGTASCVTVVTSRDWLAGLVARDGAVRLDLDVLPPAEAIGLLRALIGPRVDAEPGVAAELARQCCFLPLALRVAAEFCAAHPAASLTDLTAELADQQRRLDLLDADADPRTAVRAVFSWSCQHLDPGAARAFRLMGLHPGPDLDRYAAAALTGTAVNQARRVLDLLIRAHLGQAARLGRYTMHDLLRAYARDLAVGEDYDDEGHAALTRLFDHYLHTAATAMDALLPAERHRRPSVPAATSPVPPMVGSAQALAWLDAELPNLAAVTAHAAGHGWPGHASHLSRTLARYLDSSGRYSEAIAIHGHALQAARRCGDKAAEAWALKDLGAVDHAQGRFQQGIIHLEAALALFGETGHLGGEAITLNILGLMHSAQGRYRQAAVYLRQSLNLHRTTGDKRGQVIALGNLGAGERRMGHLREAVGHFQQAQELCRETGDRSGLAMTLIRLGALNLQQDRHEEAARQLHEALSIFRSIGERSGEADSLSFLGVLDLRQGHYQQVVGKFEQALSIQRGLGDNAGIATSLNGMGEASLCMGRPADASSMYTAALEVASRIGLKDQEARAHDGLARSHHVTGDLDQARRHWQQALAIYTDIGAPEAGQIRIRLTAADAEGLTDHPGDAAVSHTTPQR